MSFPSASFTSATTSHCWCRSRSTRHTPGGKPAHASPPLLAAKSSIARSAALSKRTRYRIERTRTNTGRKISLSGQRAFTTSFPPSVLGGQNSMGRPRTLSQYAIASSFIPPSIGCLASPMVSAARSGIHRSGPAAELRAFGEGR